MQLNSKAKPAYAPNFLERESEPIMSESTREQAKRSQICAILKARNRLTQAQIWAVFAGHVHYGAI
jgi:hypothetical protein